MSAIAQKHITRFRNSWVTRKQIPTILQLEKHWRVQSYDGKTVRDASQYIAYWSEYLTEYSNMGARFEDPWIEGHGQH